jgi:hypothetical protein
VHPGWKLRFEIGGCGAATDAFPAEAGATGMVLRLDRGRPVGARLPAKTAWQSTDSSQAECIRQQAGAYSRLHSASKTSADGEIGVSRDWTRSVM